MAKHPQTPEEKEQELEDRLIYAASENSSALAAGNCGVCKRKGFPIFLARKAIISKNSGLVSKDNQVVSLGNREPKNEAELTTHQYVYRTLRKGYVYILAKRKDNSAWQYIGYEVTPSGGLRHKTIHEMKERNIMDIPIACHNDSHYIDGMFATIDTSIYEGTAYIAYTRRAWSKFTLDSYIALANGESVSVGKKAKKNNAKETVLTASALSRFSKIILSDVAYANPKALSPDGRSFAFRDFADKQAYLLEAEADPAKIGCFDSNEAQYEVDASSKKVVEISSAGPQEPLENMRSRYHFITTHPFNSLRDKSGHINGSSATKFYAKGKALSKNGINVPTLVLEDPFGIAEELSFQRQLNVEPITQMIIAAGKQYDDKLLDMYKQTVSADKAVRNHLDSLIAQYRKQHPEEAAIIYNGEGRKKEGFIFKNVVNDNFLDDKYKPYYSNLLDSNIKCGHYFNEKHLHLRKALSYIDSFEGNLRAWHTKMAQNKVVYDYVYTNPYSAYSYSNFSSSSLYLKNGYQEKPMTDKERREHLADMNKGWLNLTHYSDVKAFVLKDSSVAEGEKNFAKDWSSYQSTLAQYRIDDFLKKDADDYNTLIESINEHSLDYFIYLTWLFSSADKPSSNTPKQVKIYNDLPFWLIECDTNSSNNHIGYVSDFIKVIDYTCLGNIKLPYQQGIWDMLLRDENTLYFHLVSPHDSSFWQLMLGARIAQMDQDAASTQALAQDDAAMTKRTEALLQQLERNHCSELDTKFFWEKGRLLLELYQQLIIRVSAGLSNQEMDGTLINRALVNQHVVTSAFVLSGHIILRYQLEKLPVSEVVKLIRYTTRSDEVGDVPFDNAKLDDDETVDVWEFVSIGSDVVDLFSKVAEVTTPESIASAKQLAGILGLYFKEAWKMNELEHALTFAVLQRTGAKLRTDIAHIASSKPSGSLSDDLRNANINSKWNNRSERMVSGVALCASALQLTATYAMHSNNLKRMEEFGLGQQARDMLMEDITLGDVKLKTQFTLLIASALTHASKSLPDAFRSTLSTSSMLSTLSNGVLKTSVTAVGVLSVVASAITIIEGTTAMQRGMRKLQNGGSGGVEVLCGGLQVVAGIIGLIQSVGFLMCATPIGIGLLIFSLVLGIAASILAYVFKDDSDDWKPMQNWMNRSLFGKWEHLDKGQPYPPTYAGMAYAMNEYLVAQTGLISTIRLNKEHYLLDSLPIYQRELAQYPQAYFPYYAPNMKALYIEMQFPADYDEGYSDFTGTVVITKKDQGKEDSVVLSISKGKQYPLISVVNELETSFFVKRGLPLGLFDKENKEDSATLHKVEENEWYGQAKDTKTGALLPYYNIRYKIGEFYALSKYEVFYQLKYWAKGKQINDGKDNLPLVVNYTYEV